MRSHRVSGDGYAVTVHRATVQMGVARQKLQDEARQGEPDNERFLLRLFTYPDCVSCSQPAQGFAAWPPTFDDWLALPEEMVREWEDAVYRINPHWEPGGKNFQEQAKETANELQRRLIALHRRRKENENAELPEQTHLNDLETSYKVWLRMEATGWRVPPSQLLNEPDWLIDDLLTIAGQWSIVERLLSKK